MKTKRREFIKKSILLTGSIPLYPYLSCTKNKKVEEITSKKNKPVGIQLYTLREDLKIDFDETLEKIATIGYQWIEAAGYNITKGTFYDLTPKIFSKKLSNIGLQLISSHTMFSPNNAEKVCSDAAEVGAKYVVIPWLPDERRNMDGYKILTEELNKSGEIAKSYNLRLGYHNHAFELYPLEEKIPYDYMLKHTEKELVCFEMDLYWMAYAKADIISYFEKYAGRFELFHVKDMSKSADKFFTPVGEGQINFEEIFKAKKRAGLKYFFVEQDKFKNCKPIESVRLSYEYLQKASFI